jgi:8-oxo-dGTP pyrophosphatase MutT (NUDIX family)
MILQKKNKVLKLHYMNKKFKREFSAGCVVYHPQKNAFLLGKHSGYHKWVLPKGLIEDNEQGWQTALRETEEEMGIKATLVSKKPIHKEQYFFYANYKDQPAPKPRRRIEAYQETGGKKTKVFKTVNFYLAQYQSGDPKDHDWEMEDAGWYSLEQALELMSFKGEKEALEKAEKQIEELSKQPSLFS